VNASTPTNAGVDYILQLIGSAWCSSPAPNAMFNPAGGRPTGHHPGLFYEWIRPAISTKLRLDGSKPKPQASPEAGTTPRPAEAHLLLFEAAA